MIGNSRHCPKEVSEVQVTVPQFFHSDVESKRRFQVNALSPGGHGLVLVFACGPSPAVKGVQDLFLDDMRVRMVAEAFG